LVWFDQPHSTFHFPNARAQPGFLLSEKRSYQTSDKGLTVRLRIVKFFTDLFGTDVSSDQVPREQHAVFWLRLALFATLLIGTVVFWTLAWSGYRDALIDADRKLERAVGLMRQHALSTFEVNDVLAGRIRDMLALDGDLSGVDPLDRERRVHARLKEVAAATPQVQSIGVWNSDGRPLASTQFFPVPPQLNGNEKDYFEAQKQPGIGLFLSGPVTERYHHDPYFLVSRRREARDGRFLGVVVIGLSTQSFNDYYREIVARSEPMALTLARPDGHVLTRSPDAASSGSSLQFDRRLADMLRGESGLPRTRRDAAGEEWLWTVRKVGGLPLYVDASMRRVDALAPWKNDLWLSGLTVLCLTLALGSSLFFALHRAQRNARALQYWHQEILRRTAAEDALRQAQKLEAIGQLTGGVAHDFNNLLMVVNTNLHILKLKAGSAPFEREIAAIGRAVTNGQSLTRQLMAFSRRQALQVEIIDLDERMPAICDLLKHSLRPGISLKCHVVPHTWPVKIDVSELELALLNLVVNARDAMPEGGAINLHIGNVKLDASVNAVDALTGEFVGVRVQDTGHGVPADLIGRVFEPFFTTKEVGKGTGLGLSQVYGFAKQSGGTAMIASQPGQGTTLTLFLPRAGMPMRLPHDSLGVILVADASPAVGDSITALLEQLGYSAQLKQDAMEVLEALTGSGPYDLLLIDVALTGGMSGFELVRVVRGRFPALPVILTTGFGASDPRVLEEGLPVLAKPFDMKALTNTLQARLGRANTRTA